MLNTELQYGDVITASDGSEWGTIRETAGTGSVIVVRPDTSVWLIAACLLERKNHGEIHFKGDIA